jgi:acyl carrier protein
MRPENGNANPAAAEIRRILLEALDLDPADHGLSSSGSIQDAVALDSVAAIRFVVALESAFGVTVEDEWLSLDRLTDLDSLAAYLRRRMSNPHGQAHAAAGPDQGGT